MDLNKKIEELEASNLDLSKKNWELEQAKVALREEVTYLQRLTHALEADFEKEFKASARSQGRLKLQYDKKMESKTGTLTSF